MAEYSSKDNSASKSPGKKSQDESLDNNPFCSLLQDIAKALDKFDSKKKILKEIESIFKKKESTIMTSTMNIWYKKYEKEADERFRAQKQLNMTMEANRILTAQVTRNSCSPLIAPTLREQNTSIEEFSRWRSNSKCTTPLLIKMRTEPDLFREFRLEKFASVAITDEDPKNCPLCSKNLHEVYRDLEEKDEKIMQLGDLIKNMTSKGQSLIAQSSLNASENCRLETINKDLQETIKVLENLITKISASKHEKERDMLSQIDHKSSEIEILNKKILTLENVLKHQHATSGTFTQDSNKGQKMLTNLDKSDNKRNEEENSSMLVKRLLEENYSLHQDVIQMRRSLLDSKKEYFILSGEKKYQETPTSGLFTEELSKIHRQFGRTDSKSLADEDTIQKLLLGNTSRHKDESKAIENMDKNQTKNIKLKKAANSKQKEKSKKREPKFNAEVQGRGQCEACRLI
jgi:hypothetical protein